MSFIVSKDAFVTGANRGIGKTFVRILLERGASKVYAAVRDLSNADDLTAAFGDRVIPILLDVTNEDHITDIANLETVSLLVNNAGIVAFTDFTNSASIEPIRREIEVNFFGTLNVTRALAPVLAKNGGGAIINIASIASFISFPIAASYSASKAAVHSLTQSLRTELAEQGTHVLGAYPGLVDTDMTADITADKETPEAVVNRILDALEARENEILPDPMAQSVYDGIFSAQVS